MSWSACYTHLVLATYLDSDVYNVASPSNPSSKRRAESLTQWQFAGLSALVTRSAHIRQRIARRAPASGVGTAWVASSRRWVTAVRPFHGDGYSARARHLRPLRFSVFSAVLQRGVRVRQTAPPGVPEGGCLIFSPLGLPRLGVYQFWGYSFSIWFYRHFRGGPVPPQGRDRGYTPNILGV